jgi:hypothetical protein
MGTDKVGAAPLQRPAPLDTEVSAPCQSPTVRDMLLAKVDDLTGRMTELVDEVREVTEQLHPERARSCCNALTMAAVTVDEIRLRAHARPIEEPEPG